MIKFGMKDQVHKLPFNSLEPYMSDEQLYTHYEKHHKTYDKNIKNILNVEEYDLKSIIDSEKQGSRLWNNAAQVHNHNLFWKSIKLDTYSPNNKHDNLIKDFKEKAMGIFGSGWAFITKDLEVVTTSNAGLCENAIITLDIWEHAYYIDHKSDRSTFIDTFIYKMMNWELVKYANFTEKCAFKIS